jgi:hypothetical protein
VENDLALADVSEQNSDNEKEVVPKDNVTGEDKIEFVQRGMQRLCSRPLMAGETTML